MVFQMKKVKLGASSFSYPMPMTLVGTSIDNRVNFMPLAWMSRVNYRPPMLAVAVNKRHYTSEGILETKTFSVNIPSVDLLVKTDYCGLVSGRKTDKSKVFEVFFGELETAPMIRDCPICLECRLSDVYKELPTNYVFFGEIVAVYCEKKYLTEGKPDIRKINPMILTMPDNKYWTIGEHAGNAWKDGRKFENLIKHTRE